MKRWQNKREQKRLKALKAKVKDRPFVVLMWDLPTAKMKELVEESLKK